MTRILIIFKLSIFLASPIQAKSIYEEVIKTLKSKHSDGEGSEWYISSADFADDWLIDAPYGAYVAAESLPKNLGCESGTKGCDPIFTRKTCSTDSDCSEGISCESLASTVSPKQSEPVSMCLHPADRLIDRFYKIISSTNRHLDFVSLSIPTGRFYEGIVNALAQLSQKENPPTVRLLFGGKSHLWPNFLHAPDKVLKLLEKDINARGGDSKRLPMFLAWISSSRLSWNHAKVLIADEARMMNGGHNAWDSDYLGNKPVFDLSLEVTGPAAQKTQDFVNVLWPKIRKFATNTRAKKPMVPVQISSNYVASTPVIGVGRLGVFGDDPADDAIIAMFDAAKDSIYLSQQDLFSTLSYKTEESWAAEALVKAAMRGVKVNIVTSNKARQFAYGMVSHSESVEYLKNIAKRLLKGKSKELRASKLKTFCESMDIAPLRFNEDITSWEDGTNLANHSKLIIVDESDFYLGSQNFYPANLIEHGLIVSDPSVTEELLQNYWRVLWELSKGAGASCR